MYQLIILNPENTTQPLSQREKRFTDWSEVEKQIIADKHQWFDCSHLPIKYQANDDTVMLNGSFGV